MSLKKLVYDKNLRSAVIFLNMFGLDVLEKENILIGDIIPVVDKDMQLVGSVTCLEDSINISAKSDLGQIVASYKPAVASLTRDVEAKGAPRSATWKTEVKYEIQKNENDTIKGICMLFSGVDDEYGTRCSVSHVIKYFASGKEIMTLRMQIGSELFGLYFYDTDIEETIVISPFSLNANYMRHDLKCGKYVRSTGYPKHIYAIIGDYSDTEKDKLDVIYNSSEYGETKEHRVIIADKADYNVNNQINGRGVVLQLGSLMRENDSKMYEIINNIRNMLSNGDVSLLDSFINVSLESFTDEEIEALLGIKKTPLKYKGQVRELRNIYFGNDSSFNCLS